MCPSFDFGMIAIGFVICIVFFMLLNTFKGKDD